MTRRRLLICGLRLLAITTWIRVGYQPLEWGGYWYVDFIPPWRHLN